MKVYFSLIIWPLAAFVTDEENDLRFYCLKVSVTIVTIFLYPNI